jgi:hypothetical protein
LLGEKPMKKAGIDCRHGFMVILKAPGLEFFNLKVFPAYRAVNEVKYGVFPVDETIFLIY